MKGVAKRHKTILYTEIALTPLHLASEQGHHIDLVKYLVIEQEINQLCEDDYGNTPLLMWVDFFTMLQHLVICI